MEIGTILFLGAGVFSLFFLTIIMVAFYNIYTKSYRPKNTIPMLLILSLLFLINGILAFYTLFNLINEF